MSDVNGKKGDLPPEQPINLAFEHSETNLEINSTPSSLMEMEGKDFQIHSGPMSDIFLSCILFQQVV